MRKLLILLTFISIPCCAQINTTHFWHKAAHIALTVGCATSAIDGAMTDVAVHEIGGYHENNRWLLTNGRLDDKKVWLIKGAVCGGGWAIDQIGDRKWSPQYRDTAAITIGAVTSVGFILLDIQDTKMLLGTGKK